MEWSRNYNWKDQSSGNLYFYTWKYHFYCGHIVLLLTSTVAKTITTKSQSLIRTNQDYCTISFVDRSLQLLPTVISFYWLMLNSFAKIITSIITTTMIVMMSDKKSKTIKILINGCSNNSSNSGLFSSKASTVVFSIMTLERLLQSMTKKSYCQVNSKKKVP